MSPPSLGENCAPWGGQKHTASPRASPVGSRPHAPRLTGNGAWALPSPQSRRLPLGPRPAHRAPRPARRWVWSMGGSCWRVEERGAGVSSLRPSSLAASLVRGVTAPAGVSADQASHWPAGPRATLVSGARGLLLGPRLTQPLGSAFQSPRRHLGSPGARLREQGQRATAVTARGREARVRQHPPAAA